MNATALFRISFIYFATVFAAGFVLGTIRVLFVVPAIGERYAELIEMPLMAIVCALAAYHLVKKFRLKLSPVKAVCMGLLALAMLLAVEFTLVLELRGLSLHEYFASRDPISGAAYLVGLTWFAIAPLVLHVRGSERDT